MDKAQLRRFPYPYKAMVAICSDLDGTLSLDHYLGIVRFLNSEQQTPAGQGIGLEVGNSIYFDMPDSQFAYWNTDDSGRAIVRELIKSGHIDCFHSFGDLAETRQHAERALCDLEEHGCRLECWVDHSIAATNFGSDIMRGSGDVVGSPAYHADITYEHGVRFVWRGRVTSIIGQDRRRSIWNNVSPKHPIASARTTAKEIGKGVLAKVGNAKYALHGDNALARRTRLRDGNTVYEFLRCNPHWKGVTAGDTADGFSEILTEKLLDCLVRRRGTSILYTHLAKTVDKRRIFGQETVKALHVLAEFSDRKDVLVTTTRRILGFWVTSRLITASHSLEGGVDSVRIDTSPVREANMPCELDGLSFYVRDSSTARIIVDGAEVANLERNAADEQGRESVSIPWRRLAYPGI